MHFVDDEKNFSIARKMLLHHFKYIERFKKELEKEQEEKRAAEANKE